MRNCKKEVHVCGLLFVLLDASGGIDFFEILCYDGVVDKKKTACSVFKTAGLLTDDAVLCRVVDNARAGDNKMLNDFLGSPALRNYIKKACFNCGTHTNDIDDAINFVLVEIDKYFINGYDKKKNAASFWLKRQIYYAVHRFCKQIYHNVRHIPTVSLDAKVESEVGMYDNRTYSDIVPDSQLNAHDQMIQDEKIQTVENFIDDRYKTMPKSRRIAKMRIFDGYDVREICEHYGFSSTHSVSERVRNIRKDLQKSIKAVLKD